MLSLIRVPALPAFCLLFVCFLTACGGSSGGKEPGAPNAFAGEDQVVSPGARVELLGLDSFDEDGTIIFWHWEQTRGTEVVLEDDGLGTATFTAPAVDGEPLELRFRLTVVDDEGKDDDDSVTIIVAANGGDGGAGGFGIVHDGPIQPENFVIANGLAFFTALSEDDTGINAPDREQLWVTDGTHSGTRKVADFGEGGAYGYMRILTPFKDGVVLTGYDGTVSGALWFSDGTEAGTRLIKDITTAVSENIFFIGVGGDYFYFMANDGVHGSELWASDGTPAGTYMIIDRNPDGDSRVERAEVATYYNGAFHLYLWHYEPGTFTARPQLYRTDGRQGNLQQLTNNTVNTSSVLLDYDMAVFNNKLYFTWKTAWDTEIWVTDGTVGGTHAVITASSVPGFVSYPKNFHLLDGKLLFFAYASDYNGSHTSLWSTDGTAAGTTRVKPVDNYWGNLQMVMLGGKYYFPGRDYANNALSLWVTDGTSGGTYQVHTVEPEDASLGMMVLMGDKLVFRGTDGVHGFEPWVSDGTTAGTFMLKDIHPESGSFTSSGGVFTARGNKAYFVAGVGVDDFHLFETDGTSGGTRIIAPADATTTTNPMGQEGWLNDIEVAAPVLLGNTLLFKGRFHGKYRLYRN